MFLQSLQALPRLRIPNLYRLVFATRRQHLSNLIIRRSWPCIRPRKSQNWLLMLFKDNRLVTCEDFYSHILRGRSQQSSRIIPLELSNCRVMSFDCGLRHIRRLWTEIPKGQIGIDVARDELGFILPVQEEDGHRRVGEILHLLTFFVPKLKERSGKFEDWSLRWLFRRCHNKRGETTLCSIWWR